jgi:hypothetical protein
MTNEWHSPVGRTTHNRSFNLLFQLPNFGRLFIVANDKLATPVIH